MSVEERVSNGVALLERRIGPDFHKQISVDRLNIASIRFCALGQTFGSYMKGSQVLGLSGTDYVENGFAAVTNNEYPKLTAAWKEALLARSA